MVKVLEDEGYFLVGTFLLLEVEGRRIFLKF